jgi:hypothetical protein
MYRFNRFNVTSLIAVVAAATSVAFTPNRASAQTVTSSDVTGSFFYNMSVGEVLHTIARVTILGDTYTPEVTFGPDGPVYGTPPTDLRTFNLTNGLNFYTDVQLYAEADGESAASMAEGIIEGEVTWTVTGTPNSTVRVSYTINASIVVSCGIAGTGSSWLSGLSYADSRGGSIVPVTINGPATYAPGEQLSGPYSAYQDVTLNGSGVGTLTLTFYSSTKVTSSATIGATGSGSAAGAGFTFVDAVYLP